MILVDISVWIDHLRAGDEGLAGLLNNAQVWTHPLGWVNRPAVICTTGVRC